uniref:RRM domain-containing protein n=1 Tax=Mesocestoides corti TaxID=53468 RepID=A0A5K3FUJ1_MESCO
MWIFAGGCGRIHLSGLMFSSSLQLDVSLIPEIRERVRTQCAKVGVVKKIVVYDTNPEGVVSVTFSTPEEADVALTFLDKALFTYPAPCTDPQGGQRTRQLDVSRWDGKERFDKQENVEEEKERLDRWNKFLGDDSDSDTAEAHAEAVAPTDTDDELEARGGEEDSGAETE